MRLREFIRESAGTQQVGAEMKKNGFPNLTPVKAPPLPTGQLEPGTAVQPQADGTTVYSGGFGAYTYDKAGTPIQFRTPSFAGLTQTTDLVTGNITVRYAVGPMDVSARFDKNGKSLESEKAQYDLGLGVLGMAKDKGITTKTWQGRGAEGDGVISSKDLYAMGNKDKEATYNRAMTQVKQPPPQ
jgi:hypothetical protein